MNLFAKNYKSLFKMQGRLTCLHSEFLVTGSLGLGSALVVCHKEDWRSFITIHGEQKCLEKGYQIFKSEKEYEEYATSFRNYIQNAKEYIIPTFTNPEERITEEKFSELIPLLARFWHYYGITEFSYHELAYQKSREGQNPVLNKNLEDLGKLKFEGREILNAFVFEQGVLITVLKSIGRQFLQDEDDALFLYSHEIFNLYRGIQVDQKIIDARKNYYAVTNEDNSPYIFSAKEAQELWLEFFQEERVQEIKGTVAFPGVVSGRVVVAPMLVDMDKISKIDASMKNGDILVAESTTPELLMLCKKAGAIVTDQGGMLSHAAIIARELKIPCVIGTGNATHTLQNGDRIEVDANHGLVKKYE